LTVRYDLDDLGTVGVGQELLGPLDGAAKGLGSAPRDAVAGAERRDHRLVADHEK
jgi:hypothetical protein